MTLHVLLQIGGELRRLRRVGTKNDISLGFNQAVFVGLSDDRGFEHSRVRGERGFDFGRRDGRSEPWSPEPR